MLKHSNKLLRFAEKRPGNEMASRKKDWRPANRRPISKLNQLTTTAPPPVRHCKPAGTLRLARSGSLTATGIMRCLSVRRLRALLTLGHKPATLEASNAEQLSDCASRYAPRFVEVGARISR